MKRMLVLLVAVMTSLILVGCLFAQETDVQTRTTAQAWPATGKGKSEEKTKGVETKGDPGGKQEEKYPMIKKPETADRPGGCPEGPPCPKQDDTGKQRQ